MKQFLFFLFLILFVSCEKEEFIYDYPKLDKLLVSVTRTNTDSEFRAEFKYDTLNRLIEVKNIFPESQTITESYVYDGQGKIVEKVNGNYLTTYTYDPDGQLVEQNIHYVSTENDNEWNEKTEFEYKNGKINKGMIYSEEGEILRYISYKYDSRGNTLKKIVHVAGSESDLGLIEYEFKYDTKVNPFTDSGVNTLNGYIFTQEADVKQINNPTYSSYMNMIMSSLPPKFEISYEYDLDGLPVKAIFNNVHYPDQEAANVIFVYRDIEK